MKNKIILGIGILILLLALAGTGSAKSAYSTAGADCGYCHVSIVSGDYTLTTDGNYFRDVHKFDGKRVPANASSCLTCHPDMTSFLPLKQVGESYSETHRYNATTLAAKILPEPGCANCHVNAVANNFNFITGTPTYLTSSVCKDCHSTKYDTWYNTTHRIKLVDKEISQAAGFPVPPGYTWDDILYTIGGKWKIRYVNTTGYVIIGPQAQYNVEQKKWAAYNTGIETKYDCGGCHTTGYDKTAPSRFGLAGFVGNWTENGVGCEACHGAGGNGHQVVVNKSAEACGKCHTRNAPTKYDIDTERRHRAQFADWANSDHAPPSVAPVTSESCRRCHSPIDYAENKSITNITAKGIVCVVCHNSHDVSDPMYANIIKPDGYGFNASDNSSNFAAVKPAKVSFFNSSATRTAGKDVYDTLTTPTLIYDRDSNYPGPINVTGPISEVLCSKCHYNHGLAHIGQVNLTHGKAYGINKATCTDCHMAKSRQSAKQWDIRSHTMKLDDGVKYTKKAPLNNFPDLTCSRGTQCHVPEGKYSVVPVVNEWKASAHNVKEVSVGPRPYNGFYFNNNTKQPQSRPVSCTKCHSPFNWDPLQDSATTNVQLTADFKGVSCTVCHNIHDMGDWIAKTKEKFGEAKYYAWYDKDGIVRSRNATTGAPTAYRPNYSIMKSTIELCGNCHSNVRRGNEGPGWASATAANPIGPHGFPAKDLFVGSWKESGLLKFECKDCHMAAKIKDSNGSILPDSQKVTGHSFKVKADLLQENTACSSCHVTGSELGNLSTTIENVQEETHAKWNTTNATVISALNKVKAYSGEKNLSRTQIAQAYWNIRLVYSDESWGVHNPTKADQLLDEAATLAAASIESLGKTGTSSVQLYAGWNLVSLNATPASTSPASVMSSVSSSLTVVWGLDAPTQTWVLYDPARPAGLNTLTKMVKGESYEIRVTNNCVWTV